MNTSYQSLNINQEFNEQRIKTLTEENNHLKEQILSYKTQETQLKFEVESYKTQVKGLKASLETMNTRNISTVISEAEEVRSLREKNAALEKKQSQIEKLSAKN